MEDKHLYRETQWDVSAEESRAHHGLVAIGFAVLAVLVIAFVFGRLAVAAALLGSLRLMIAYRL